MNQDWKDMLTSTRNAITSYELAAKSLQGVLLGQGFVVRCQGLCLAFDIDAGVVLNPQFSQPQMATRFSKDDAVRVADEVKNGNGIAGEAVHVRDAIADALVEQRELLALLEDHSNTTSNQQ
jgi:hypothetical protein